MDNPFITEQLIQRIKDDTGSSNQIAMDMAIRLSQLSPALVDVTARWAEHDLSDEELTEVKTGNISLLTVMKKEKKRFVEAVFTLSALEQDPDRAMRYLDTAAVRRR